MWLSGIRGRESVGLGALGGAGAGPGLALQLPWLPQVCPVGEGWGAGLNEEESLFPSNDMVQLVCGNRVQVSRAEDCG